MTYRSFNTSLPSPLNSEDTGFCLYGRNGLHLVSKSILERHPKKLIALLPDYACGDEVMSIIQAGFTINYYKVNPQLEIDMGTLVTQLQPDVGLVLITHYFGFPQQQFSEILRLAHSVGAYCIEDCAHVVDTLHNNAPLGTMGDFSIFSLRKFLPLPHGGAYLINNPDIPQPHFVEPSEQVVELDEVVRKAYIDGSISKGTHIETIYEYMGFTPSPPYGPRHADQGGYSLGMSDLGKDMIGKLDIPNLLDTRRKAYEQCHLFFLKHPSDACEPLFKTLLPQGSLLFYPVKVSDSEKLHKKLIEKNISCGQPFWSKMQPFINWEDHPDAAHLKQSLYALSLNTYIHESKLEAFAHCAAAMI